VAFVPENELEQHLIAAQEGRLGLDQFMQHLLAAQLFMPIYDRHHIGGFQPDDKAQPLTLETEEGAEVLVLFTAPERAKTFLAEFPGYEGGLLAEFTWILERTGVGIGITLNPGLEVGFDIEPEMVQQLARQGKTPD